MLGLCLQKRTEVTGMMSREGLCYEKDGADDIFRINLILLASPVT